MPDGATATEVGHAANRQRTQFEEQQAKVAAIRRQIGEKKAEIAEASTNIQKAAEILPLLIQEDAMRHQTFALRIGNKYEMLEIDQRLVGQQFDLQAATEHRRQAQETLAALIASEQEAVSGFRHSIFDELEKAEQGAIQARADEARASDKIELETLHSPVNGTVQQLQVSTIGGSLASGETVMSIVPDDAPLEADLMIENKDVGFVHVGQPVALKIDAFPYERYGAINGTIVHISLDAADADHRKLFEAHETSEDDKKGKVADAGYIARVQLSRTAISTEDGIAKLEPGMRLTADIKTGSRRVVSYFLSPVRKAFYESIRER